MALGNPRAPVRARGKQALRPPTTPVPSLQLNLARQQCSAIYNEGVDQFLCNCFTSPFLLLPLCFIELIHSCAKRPEEHTAALKACSIWFGNQVSPLTYNVDNYVCSNGILIILGLKKKHMIWSYSNILGTIISPWFLGLSKVRPSVLLWWTMCPSRWLPPMSPLGQRQQQEQHVQMHWPLLCVANRWQAAFSAKLNIFPGVAWDP